MSLPAAATGCPQIGPVSDHGSSAATGSPIAIQVGDSYFAPTCLTGVHPGTVILQLQNTGTVLHNISIPEQNIDSDIPPGQTITVSALVGVAALSYFCKYHRTSGMLGALAPSNH